MLSLSADSTNKNKKNYIWRCKNWNISHGSGVDRVKYHFTNSFPLWLNLNFHFTWNYKSVLLLFLLRFIKLEILIKFLQKWSKTGSKVRKMKIFERQLKVLSQYSWGNLKNFSFRKQFRSFCSLFLPATDDKNQFFEYFIQRRIRWSQSQDDATKLLSLKGYVFECMLHAILTFLQLH